MPRSLVLAEAKQAEVARLAREALQERGGRIDEQTSARIIFEGVETAGGFARGGYVGAYQPLGEKSTEVQIEAWAVGPRRAFWVVVALELVGLAVLFGASPPSQVWFLAALILWPIFGLVALIYYLTLPGSRALEDELTAAFHAKFTAAALVVLDEDRQLERRIRERLEGEVKQREIAARTAADPPARGRGRFGLGGKGAEVPAETSARAGQAAKSGKRGLFGSKPKG